MAGLIGGLAGAGAMTLAEIFFPPRIERQNPSAVTETGQVAEQTLPKNEKHAIRWGLGAAVGAAYGAMVEANPSLGAWGGAAFGVTLNKITNKSLLPKLGLGRPKNEQPTQERISGWVTYVAYGIATDVVRRTVRRVL